MDRYDPHSIERRWQAEWRRTRLYEPDLAAAQKPYYNLMMFPYPSAEGLHVGNVFAYTGADIHGRYMAMSAGCDVFEPIGFDAFGIHSENFAIKRNEHPRELTARNVENFRERQLERIGNRFDWSRAVNTTDPAYYRWTQWIFLQLYKAGLAIRKAAPVNWCPTDQTVLADEQVIDGRCERCSSVVVERTLEQWFLRITAYADRLLDNLDHLDWAEVVKTAQRNWIGRSEDGTYRLRDWLISRQRYWGPPIPIVYCAACRAVPVPEEQLPVLLPETEQWRGRGTGSSPLADIPEFVQTTCPKCGAPARRETDVSDNFLDSAWYFLRYPSACVQDRPFDPQLTKKWLPVDMYIGGAEHAVLHLLYSRFITMALHDLGYLEFDEPFTRFRAHGLLIMSGAKISKSRGNVVNPDDYIQRYGADTLRMFLMFLGPFDRGGEFSERGIAGVWRFLKRMWQLVLSDRTTSMVDRRPLHDLIQRVTADVEALRYNTAIAALMAFVNQREALDVEAASVLLRLLAPFAPHLAEELWSRIGQPYSIHQQAWPVADSALVAPSTVPVAIQVNGRTRGIVQLAPDATQAQALAAASAMTALQPHLSHPTRIVYRAGKVLNVVISI
jgi:leucyl-tRNA synthetase